MPTSAANTQQLEAMMTAADLLLIIAGLGSGERKSLTPESIMVVTITDEAGKELSPCSSKHLSAGSGLQPLSYIEAHYMWHQNRCEDVFNGRQV